MSNNEYTRTRVQVDEAKLAEVIVQAERNFVGVPTLELLEVHHAMADAVAEWFRGGGQ